MAASLLQIGISTYNPLVVALALLSAGTAIAALYVAREARGRHAATGRDSFAWLFGLLGLLCLLVAGELFWADWAGFPADHYTELFGVAQTLFAAVLLAAAAVVHGDLDPKPFAWLTAVSAAFLLQGGRGIIAFELTRSPALAATIWVAAGLAGLLLLPAAYLAPETAARRGLLLAIAGLLVVVAVVALGMGVMAHYAHLAELVGA